MMSAHEYYTLLVGEIGIERGCFLRELRFWEVKSIVRGYNRRSRELWSSVRWATFHLMQVSMADLRKAGIQKPQDLLVFPWETGDEVAHVSDEDVEELQALMEGAEV